MGRLRLIFFIFLLTTSYQLRATSHISFAKDNYPDTLTNQIIATKNTDELYAPFKELKDFYFKDNKYNEFIEFLKSLGQKKKGLATFVSYYTALSRYQQLKHLEVAQKWDEYFSSGDKYRQELQENVFKIIDSTKINEPLNLYARLLFWQFAKDQQDTSCNERLSGLLNALYEYAKDAKDISVIKEVAQQLLARGEKISAKQVYKIYVEKLAASEINLEDLGSIALDSYNQGNLELAESVYDLYQERIIKAYPKEKFIPILIDIAKKFVYEDAGLMDPFYAEEVFSRLEQVAGKDAFDEQLLYLRAFNLEKNKEYTRAKDIYLELVKLFPSSKYTDEAIFKIGIISTYILSDASGGKNYFKQLAQKETTSAQVISSLYQLGLLNQWEENFTQAKEFYDQLIERAKDSFLDTQQLTQQRLKEILETKPLEYNLKTFLDVCLKKENVIFGGTKIDLRSHPHKLKKEEDTNITTSVGVLESGCMQVEIQYLWSGHLGVNTPSITESSFQTKYVNPGTKEINLVVVSPAGVIDRNLDMVDVD